MKNARAERAKLLFLLIKYAQFVTFSLPSRRRFYTPKYLLKNTARRDQIHLTQFKLYSGLFEKGKTMRSTRVKTCREFNSGHICGNVNSHHFAMLVSPNNEMAAMLLSRSNPPGIESYYYANVFFCFR